MPEFEAVSALTDRLVTVASPNVHKLAESVWVQIRCGFLSET